MKSKTSCFSKTIFRKNITHFWPIWCLFLLFYLFIMPFSEFIGYLGEKAGYDTGKTLAEKMAESILIPETIQIVFNPVILLIFSLIAAGAVFSYLYTSRASYTMHAFPVTRTSLFITNYVSGLLFLWGPMLLGGLLGILVAAGCGYSYIEILFKGVLCAMGISLFFYSFNVFIGILVGQLIAMPVFSLILNFLFVGSKYILTQLFSCFAYGISGEYQNGVLDVLSPLYYISSHIRVNIQYSGGWSKAVCTGMTGAKMVAGYALAAVVFLVLAFVLYQRRHLETAGNLIAFSWITPLFRWGVGACFASLGAMTAGSIMFSSNSGTKRFVMILMAGIVVGVLFFFAAEMVLQKSFRVFAKKRFRECGLFALALAFVLILLKMDVLGIEGKVPEAGKVKEAYIQSGDFAGGEDTEMIEKIIALHENILSHKALYQNIESPWEDGYGINLKYYMKDGSVLTRYYVVAQDESARSDENSPVSVARAYMREGETYKKNVLGLNYKDNKYLYGNINFPEKVAKDDYGNPITSSTSREFTAEQSEKICEAFMKDVDAGNFKNQWYSGEAEKYDKLVFENTISFSYTNSKGYEEYSDRFYSGRNYAYVMDSGNAYIQFNTECENIIQALIDMEMIKSPDELITRWDMEQTPLPEE
ncbi:hypothetical protein [Roseburia sp. 1XD42-69]|uniref:hypothetical protein n=1 Tax=Roseburia sp. 1XD42-69 TaxID=2320088 RepID=UPI000EA0DFE7|nr:hypothetical protein [Roseburia sp. 1XD42-69]MDE6904493.1 hypothetical protein [Lachnospiraceae bacterium]RKJ66522.1 hypothetical protein D7Y06_07085 [Roseburia sp. 1XD42-69]